MPSEGRHSRLVASPRRIRDGSVFITRSAEETRDIGGAFSKKLKKGDVLFLSGDLGCGKTTLVQGIARGFGIKDAVRSSSFMLANEYRSPRVTIYHIDLYRLEGGCIDDFGLEEYVFGDGICIIEWASKIRRFPAASAWEVTLTWLAEGVRKIEFHHFVQPSVSL